MHGLTCYVCVSFFVTLCIAAPTKPSNGCGYEACNLGNPTKLNVHIVPHSHDDVGWQKTIDQYYYGAREDIQRFAAVQYILDSVVIALDENPDRRFIYVEIAFFWRWWIQQTQQIRDKVIDFVNNGRLEFISGGWSMNDEASTHYNSIIDQHTLGAQFLRDQFGGCGRPKIGWQIDPFGHSREQASIFAQMGFDGMFIGRADYQDIQTRNQTRTMEMIWRASKSLGDNSILFTGILPHGYGPPTTFCFDFRCMDEPIMDNVHLHDYNVPERVQSFIQAAQDQALSYATNHIIMTFGGDFNYQNALSHFKNLDKLIKYVNAEQANGSNVNVFYSTPSCYVYALNKLDRAWTSKTDDFFPYASHLHGYWTGYFSSRAALKRYERHANHILQVTRQLGVFSNLQARNALFYLSEPMGVLQHHDAVSGTEKQEIAFDYAQRISAGIDIAQPAISQAYSRLLPKSDQSPPPPAQFLCQLSNISQCLEIDGQDKFTLTLWNPTIHPVVHHPRIAVRTDYIVYDTTGQALATELIPLSDATMRIPGRTSVTQKQIVFKVMLPALGFSTYYFEKKPDADEIDESKVKITQNEACTLQNQNIQVQISAQGNLTQIMNLNKNITVPFSSQGFYWYQGFPGNGTSHDTQASGAYIFRPFTQTPSPVSTTRTVTCFKGQFVQTAVITFTDWATQEINLYDDGESVEVEWTVGPIPIDDMKGKEIILRYNTNITSQAKFSTDANGREMLERTRDFRPTWNYTVTEPVSGNYYPVNSRIYIKDNTRQLTVLTDRSEGGSSMVDGSIELMVHRRLVYDDRLGAHEALNETAFGQGLVVRGRHILIVEPPATSALYHRVGAQRLYMHPLATFGITQQTFADYSAAYRLTWSALTDQLPLNVHLLTLDQLDAKTFLVRVEHYFELFEDTTYSQPVTFDLQSIFKNIGNISSAVEMTLAANLESSNPQRLSWLTGDEKSSPMNSTEEESLKLKDPLVRLIPMQIRTFEVTIA